MTLLDLLRTEKAQDAIGGAIGVLLALTFGHYVLKPRAAEEQVSACTPVPYTPEQRNGECFKWQP